MNKSFISFIFPAYMTLCLGFEIKWQHFGNNTLKCNIRGLSGKFADIANKTRNMYHRLKKFCINKYEVSKFIYELLNGSQIHK